MNKVLRIMVTMIAICSLAFSAFAKGEGTTSSNLLNIFLNARGAALGNAFAGAVADANALAYNPAGLASVTNGIELTFSHVGWYANTSVNYASVVLPRDLGTFGIGLSYFDQGSIEAILGSTKLPDGNFYSASDFAAYFGFGRPITAVIDLGAAVNYIYHRLGTESAGSFAFNLGLLAHFNEYRYTVGLALRNFGTSTKFREEAFEPPNEVVAGLGANLVDTDFLDLNVLADAVFPMYGVEQQFNLGGEIWIMNMLAVRVGYRVIGDAFAESDNPLTYGAGFQFADFVKIDYAFQDHGMLEDVHRITTSFKFAPPVVEEPVMTDTDGDGIFDDMDNCPDQPEDFDQWQDADGCPDPDNDNDGILDVDDKCPIIPEIYNDFQDDDGCPDVPPPPEPRTGTPDNIETSVKDGMTKLIVPIYFDFDSYKLNAKAKGDLDQVASALKQYYPDQAIIVAAHTDERGSDEYNMALSKKRANAVIDYLVNSQGFSRSKLNAVPYGESQAVCFDHDDSCWSRNRRVEFVVNNGNGVF